MSRLLDRIRRVVVMVLLAPVHLWRTTIVFRQPRCRYYPSCSTYALGALRTHGPLRGSVMAAERVLRCHPWSPGGIDPVPERPAARLPASSVQSPAPSPVQSSGVRDA
jgi:putative membrane protein insertion efficiency factor